jgi:hypothetical protein
MGACLCACFGALRRASDYVSRNLDCGGSGRACPLDLRLAFRQPLLGSLFGFLGLARGITRFFSRALGVFDRALLGFRSRTLSVCLRLLRALPQFVRRAFRFREEVARGGVALRREMIPHFHGDDRIRSDAIIRHPIQIGAGESYQSKALRLVGNGLCGYHQPPYPRIRNQS